MSPEITTVSLSFRFWFPSLAPLSFPMLSTPESISPFPTDFQGPVSFRIILTTSFYNPSWTQNQGSAWLDDLQTHGWDNKTGAFIYLQPWSKGNFSNEELTEVEKLFYTYSIRSPSAYHNHISQWQLECKFISLWVGFHVASVCVSLSSFFL